MPDNTKAILEFGQELVAARTARGLTLEQIADVTKISLSYLRAMEAGDWEFLPAPYMEAFLKAYGEAVGMNVPKIVKRYREMVHTQPKSPIPSESGTAPNPSPTEETDAGKKPSKSWLIYAITGLVILAAAAVAYYLQHKSASPGAVSAPLEYERLTSKSDSTRQVVSDSARKVDSLGHRLDSLGALKVTPDSLLAAPKEVPTGIRLTGRAIRPCWIRATLDKKKIQDILLAAGDTIAWRAGKEVELVVGNAGGLELEMDGQSLGLMGPPGKVVTVLISPEGIKSQKMDKVHLPPDSLLNIKPKASIDPAQTDSTR
jgi:cytoskeleton protein RodZ